MIAVENEKGDMLRTAQIPTFGGAQNISFGDKTFNRAPRPIRKATKEIKVDAQVNENLPDMANKREKRVKKANKEKTKASTQVSRQEIGEDKRDDFTPNLNDKTNLAKERESPRRSSAVAPNERKDVYENNKDQKRQRQSNGEYDSASMSSTSSRMIMTKKVKNLSLASSCASLNNMDATKDSVYDSDDDIRIPESSRPLSDRVMTSESEEDSYDLIERYRQIKKPQHVE